jgi:hypothetical protein
MQEKFSLLGYVVFYTKPKPAYKVSLYCIMAGEKMTTKHILMGLFGDRLFMLMLCLRGFLA